MGSNAVTAKEMLGFLLAAVSSRCCGLCLDAGVIDDDAPVISSAGREPARRVQAVDEYDENVRHDKFPGTAQELTATQNGDAFPYRSLSGADERRRVKANRQR